MIAPMALGEAYVVVRADLRPFARDLKRQLKNVTEDFEKQIAKELGITLEKDAEKAGDRAGKGVSRGLKKNLGEKKLPIWAAVGGALASALDDGISALPSEVKAGIVLGGLTAAPLLAGALSAAISAGVGVGVAGLGVLLASQFVEVEERWKDFIVDSRHLLVESAQAFGHATIDAIDIVERELQRLEPTLRSIFDKGAGFLEPLTEGAVQGLVNILESIENSMDNIGGFVEELGVDFSILGDAIGDAIEILSSTGDDGEQALRDLVFITGQAIVSFSLMLKILTHLYGRVRDLAELLGPLSSLFGTLTMAVGETGGRFKGVREEADSFNPVLTNTIGLTKEEEKAAKAAARAIEQQAAAMNEARNAAFSLVDAQIAFEESLDALSEDLKGGRDALNVETEKGRENLKLLSSAIRDAQRVAEERFASGKINAEQANALYQQEIALIYQRATAEGISAAAIRKVFDEAIKLVNLPQPDPSFWNKLIGWAAALKRETARALANAQKLRSFGDGRTIPFGGGIPEFADGGINRTETLARISEGDTPEVIIPLTKPHRAAQLMQQSGLTNLIGNMGSTLVQVFLGEEQLEQRMVRVVESNNRSQAMSLSYGPR